MYDEESDTSALPKSWNLCDDLGQIEYIFSDKTGTLTSNMMDFKKASINGIQYGKWIEPASYKGKTPTAMMHLEEERALMTNRWKEFVDCKYMDPKAGFIDASIPLQIRENGLQGKRIREFFSVLAICHTVLVEKTNDPNSNDIFYRAQSPDESALVNAAKNVGFVCLNRTDNKIDLDILGEKRTYTILNIMEFNSDRKRMGIIVQRPEGDIMLMCKGADSVIYERLNKDASNHISQETSKHLQMFANNGIMLQVNLSQ